MQLPPAACLVVSLGGSRSEKGGDQGVVARGSVKKRAFSSLIGFCFQGGGNAAENFIPHNQISIVPSRLSEVDHGCEQIESS